MNVLLLTYIYTQSGFETCLIHTDVTVYVIASFVRHLLFPLGVLVNLSKPFRGPRRLEQRGSSFTSSRLGTVFSKSDAVRKGRANPTKGEGNV
ncbi:hypothetical protein BDZ91DRAFT_711799 [Kalaharituber pfeilii]|nr:hypothetical protein BDZ91DRAFT_711799 [Kalaharituber pfeilii]